MRLSLSTIQPFLALGEINPRDLGPRNSKATRNILGSCFIYLKNGIHGPQRVPFGKYHREHGRVLGGISPRVTALELIKLCWMEEGAGR